MSLEGALRYVSVWAPAQDSLTEWLWTKAQEQWHRKAAQVTDVQVDTVDWSQARGGVSSRFWQMSFSG